MEILEGLKAGDAVVTSAQFLLDSESSKTSDFRRMHMEPAEETQQAEPASQPAQKPASVWAEASINAVMADELKINVNHAAIPEWGWPQMQMDFAASEWVDLDELVPGAQVQIEIVRLEDGGYRINDVYVTGQQ